MFKEKWKTLSRVVKNAIILGLLTIIFMIIGLILIGTMNADIPLQDNKLDGHRIAVELEKSIRYLYPDLKINGFDVTKNIEIQTILKGGAILKIDLKLLGITFGQVTQLQAGLVFAIILTPIFLILATITSLFGLIKKYGKNT